MSDLSGSPTRDTAAPLDDERTTPMTKKSLPYPVGTALRCTRPTPWGDDVVHGIVEEWHNEEGWLVVNPFGGIVAGPGKESYLFSDTSPAEWSFELIDVAALDARS